MKPFLLSGSGQRKPLFYIRRRPDGSWMVGRSGHGMLKQFPTQARACAWRNKAAEIWLQNEEARA